jgi:hypothetical protein
MRLQVSNDNIWRAVLLGFDPAYRLKYLRIIECYIKCYAFDGIDSLLQFDHAMHTKALQEAAIDEWQHHPLLLARPEKGDMKQYFQYTDNPALPEMSARLQAENRPRPSRDVVASWKPLLLAAQSLVHSDCEVGAYSVGSAFLEPLIKSLCDYPAYRRATSVEFLVENYFAWLIRASDPRAVATLGRLLCDDNTLRFLSDEIIAAWYSILLDSKPGDAVAARFAALSVQVGMKGSAVLFDFLRNCDTA